MGFLGSAQAMKLNQFHPMTDDPLCQIFWYSYHLLLQLYASFFQAMEISTIKEVEADDEKMIVSEKKEKDVIPILPSELPEIFEKNPELKIGPQPSVFDARCPDSGSVDIQDSNEVQEWVFNHLPLSHAQKKEFLAVLLQDKIKTERKQKQTELIKKMKKQKQKKQEKEEDGTRKSVKQKS
jgi:hypothetical protein